MKNLFLSTALQLYLCLFLVSGLLNTVLLQAQNEIDSLKNQIGEVHGKKKLLVLNELTAQYLAQQKTRQALNYAKRAEMLAENIIVSTNNFITEADYYLKPLAYLQLGQAYQQRGRYLESKVAFENTLREAESINHADLVSKAKQHIEEIDRLIDTAPPPKKRFLEGVLEDISTTTNRATSNLSVGAILKLAELREKNGNYEKAIKHYREAIDLLKDQGQSQKIEALQKHIADLSEKERIQTEAMEGLQEEQQQKERLNDKNEAVRIQRRMDEMKGRKPQVTNTKKDLPEQIPEMLDRMDKEISKAVAKASDMKRIAERAESSQDYEKSLIYFKKYAEMEKKLLEETRQQELALLDKAFEIENQEREITLLKQKEAINKAELKRQAIFQQSMGGGLLLLAGLLFSLYLLYHNKKRDHTKLNTAYQKLEVAQNHLKVAEQRIKGLLHQHVSKAVANELLASNDDQKVERRFVCVLFLDIRNFTPFVEKLTPEEIIDYQNSVFGFMMETITRRKGIVNQIMGDGFMATFGAPVSAGNDCLEAYFAAREIMDSVNEKSKSGEIPPTKVGIGLHAGSVVTGNVGTKTRKQFSVTGTPVIIAARLEQLNKEYGSTMVISKEVYEQLPNEVKPTVEFKEADVKGVSKPIEVATFY